MMLLDAMMLSSLLSDRESAPLGQQSSSPNSYQMKHILYRWLDAGRAGSDALIYVKNR